MLYLCQEVAPRLLCQASGLCPSLTFVLRPSYCRTEGSVREPVSTSAGEQAVPVIGQSHSNVGLHLTSLNLTGYSDLKSGLFPSLMATVGQFWLSVPRFSIAWDLWSGYVYRAHRGSPTRRPPIAGIKGLQCCSEGSPSRQQTVIWLCSQIIHFSALFIYLSINQYHNVQRISQSKRVSKASH